MVNWLVDYMKAKQMSQLLLPLRCRICMEVPMFLSLRSDLRSSRHRIDIENDVVFKYEDIIFVEAAAGAYHTLLRSLVQGRLHYFSLSCCPGTNQDT